MSFDTDRYRKIIVEENKGTSIVILDKQINKITIFCDFLTKSQIIEIQNFANEMIVSENYNNQISLKGLE